MYKKIICILILLISLFVLCSCKFDRTNQINNEISEWVSPDGVHYWYESVNLSFMAPRYGKDGNLVIDKE